MSTMFIGDIDTKTLLAMIDKIVKDHHASNFNYVFNGVMSVHIENVLYLYTVYIFVKY